MKRKPTGLKQIEKYTLMRWIDEHREQVMATDDAAMAEHLADVLELPHLTCNHVAGARRSLGMAKAHHVPKNEPVQLAELRTMVVDLCCVVRDLAGALGSAGAASDVQRIIDTGSVMP